ncbi:MAG: hypothetical protein V2A73_22690, partial [Pseudomonadota bacterium]
MTQSGTREGDSTGCSPTDRESRARLGDEGLDEEMGLGRIAGIIDRHRTPVLSLAGIVSVVGIAWALSLPSVYQARAVVRIADPSPGREYVLPTVREPALERMKSRRLDFISKQLVVAALEKIGGVPHDRASDGEVTNALAFAHSARLEVKQEGEDSFILLFDDVDPGRATAFLQALLESYAKRKTEETKALALGTAEFFGREVEDLRSRVASAQAEVERFRGEHYGALPDQLEANLRMLDETMMDIRSLASDLETARG